LTGSDRDAANLGVATARNRGASYRLLPANSVQFYGRAGTRSAGKLMIEFCSRAMESITKPLDAAAKKHQPEVSASRSTSAVIINDTTSAIPIVRVRLAVDAT
jgi:hypothetical protein